MFRIKAALLTGCYPNRLENDAAALGPSAGHGIHEDETTMAELFKSKGTTGMLLNGIWDIIRDSFRSIMDSTSIWAFRIQTTCGPGISTPKNWPKLPMIEGDEPIEIIEDYADQDAITRRLTERSVDFIHRNAIEPFFLYLAHPQPHVPLGADTRFKGTSEQGFYGDVMQELDWSLGQVLQALDEEGIADETLVMFTSDNGPLDQLRDHQVRRPVCGRQREPPSRWRCSKCPALLVLAGHVLRKSCQRHQLDDHRSLLVAARIHRCGASRNCPSTAGMPSVVLTSERERPLPGTSIFSTTAGTIWRWRTVGSLATASAPYLSIDGEASRWHWWKTDDYTYESEQPLALYDIILDPGETTDVKSAHADVVSQMLELVESARADLGDSLTDRQGEVFASLGVFQMRKRPPAEILAADAPELRCTHGSAPDVR